MNVEGCPCRVREDSPKSYKKTYKLTCWVVFEKNNDLILSFSFFFLCNTPSARFINNETNIFLQHPLQQFNDIGCSIYSENIITNISMYDKHSPLVSTVVRLLKLDDVIIIDCLWRLRTRPSVEIKLGRDHPWRQRQKNNPVKWWIIAETSVLSIAYCGPC